MVFNPPKKWGKIVYTFPNFRFYSNIFLELALLNLSYGNFCKSRLVKSQFLIILGFLNLSQYLIFWYNSLRVTWTFIEVKPINSNMWQKQTHSFLYFQGDFRYPHGLCRIDTPLEIGLNHFGSHLIILPISVTKV